jgi:hypothetical protein
MSGSRVGVDSMIGIVSMWIDKQTHTSSPFELSGEFSYAEANHPHLDIIR